jgi:RNase P/RNase MRP subunit p30
MADLLSTSGYGTVGLTVSTGLLNERIRAVRRIFEEHGVSTVLRVDFKPSSRTELLRLLRRFRNMYDIVAVRSVNQQVATVSCRDRRVDIVFFDPANRNLRFGHTFARLLHGAVEFNVVSELTGQSQLDGIVFSRLRKGIMVAREHHANIILSSGARDYAMIRSPLQISALGVTLGLSHEEAVRCVSSGPLSIVAENREKRAPEYVEEGVKVVARPGR